MTSYYGICTCAPWFSVDACPSKVALYPRSVTMCPLWGFNTPTLFSEKSCSSVSISHFYSISEWNGLRMHNDKFPLFLCFLCSLNPLFSDLSCNWCLLLSAIISIKGLVSPACAYRQSPVWIQNWQRSVQWLRTHLYLCRHDWFRWSSQLLRHWLSQSDCGC